MRAIILGLLTAAVLALAYAALDDITTNPQPNYTAEYVWLALTGIWLIVVGFMVPHRSGRRAKPERQGDA
jgi:hypothetical protein